MRNFSACATLIVATTLLQNIYGLNEDDFCTTSKGEKGMCKKDADCKQLPEMLANPRLKPKICGWQKDGRSPIICCPSDGLESNKVEATVKPKSDRGGSEKVVDRSKLVNLARQKCVEYGKYVKTTMKDPAGLSDDIIHVDNCGRLAEPMIVGGVEARPKEFPHMAMIGYYDVPQYLCGGSLISERFVLSAAHCSKPVGKGAAKWVMLGELDTSTELEGAFPQVYKIIEIINHPKFDESTYYFDISLFKLEENVAFNGYIRPLCLDTNLKDTEGLLTASGWGHTEFGGVRSSKLMKVTLKYVSNDVCNYNYTNKGSTAKLPQGMDETLVCAGGEKGLDACQGDSGGPLQANLTEPYCMYDLVGVTSYGKGCGSRFPGVYTRVSQFITWIVPHVWPNDIQD